MIIRDAEPGDAQALADVAIMAGHGVMQLLYEGLLPGKSVADAIIERRILNPESFAAVGHWRVVTDGAGNFLGALNSFPHEVLMTAPDDPLLDEARWGPIAGLTELEALAGGSYYVNIIAVMPEHRGTGAGHGLMQEAEALARRQGFNRMALCTFDGDGKLLRFYQRQGYGVMDRRPIKPHPLIDATGNFLLMGREI